MREDWIQLAQDRNQLRTTVRGNEPSGGIEVGAFLDQPTDS
jgi:hypothetical protein